MTYGAGSYGSGTFGQPETAPATVAASLLVTAGLGAPAGILVTAGLGLESTPAVDGGGIAAGASYGNPLGTFGPFRALEPDEDEEELLLLLLELI